MATVRRGMVERLQADQIEGKAISIFMSFE
jgi:hypothetical protein